MVTFSDGLTSYRIQRTFKCQQTIDKQSTEREIIGTAHKPIRKFQKHNGITSKNRGKRMQKKTVPDPVIFPREFEGFSTDKNAGLTKKIRRYSGYSAMRITGNRVIESWLLYQCLMIPGTKERECLKGQIQYYSYSSL